MNHFVEHKLLRGPGAGKWLPFARTKVAALHARARAERTSALSQHWNLEAGMVDVTVRVVEDQRYIRIRRKTCPPFLSGFTDFTYHTFPLVFSPIWEIANPTPPPDTINVFRRFFPSPAQEEPPRAWRDEPKLAVNDTAARQLGTLQASMFSGEMRKVVQVLQGMNVEIPYSPYFHPTHGIFVAQNGDRWIVEISNQGVVAWAMKTCRAPILDREGEVLLDYTPIVTPKLDDLEALEAAVAAGTFIALIGHITMQEFYNKHPMFTHCGWAFSEDGHKAANVCNWKLGGFEPTETFLYEITIDEVENRPVVGTLTQIATGIYHGDRVYAQVKYPKPNEALYSFDPFDGIFSDVLSEAPIYTYYDGAERIDAYYKNDPNAGSSASYSESDENACGHIPASIMGVEIRQGGSSGADPTPHFIITGLGELPGLINSSNINYITRTLGERLGQNLTGANRITDHIYDVYPMFVDAGIRSTLERDFYAFVVPYGEREAFYLARRHEYGAEYPTRETRFEIVTTGPTYALGDVCRCATSSVTLVVAGLGAIVGPGALCAGQPEVTQLSVSAMPSPSCHVGGAAGFVGGVQILYQNPDHPEACGQIGGNPGNCAQKVDVYACFCPGGASSCFSQVTTDTSESANAFGVEFHGSGNVKVPFSPDNKQDDWFFFLEPDQVQFVVAYRDAFVPDTVIISPEMDTNDGNELYSTADDYPVNEAGRYFNFVGVP